MAQPAGSIAVGDLYMKADFTGAVQSAYFIIKGSPHPQDYQTDNRPGLTMPLKVTRQVDIATGATLTEYWRIGEQAKPAFATNPVTKDGAFAGEISHNQVQYPRGNVMGGKAHTYEKIKFVIAKWDFHSSHATNQCDIYSVAFRANPDTSYTGAGVELLRRDTANQRLYRDDMPCSAWHVMSALAETHEKILYENRPAFSLPVFGQPYVYVP